MLARLTEVLALRACDVEDVLFDGAPALSFRFRMSKCDPSHKGAVSHIVRVGGMMCVYTIVLLYMTKAGFIMGNDEEITDEGFLFPRTNQVGDSRYILYNFLP